MFGKLILVTVSRVGVQAAYEKAVLQHGVAAKMLGYIFLTISVLEY